jgi:hypothetical protein
MFPSRAHGFFQRVVSVVLAPFLLPLLLTLSNASDATLPACCRRGGKHHCAMPDRSRPPGPKGLLGVLVHTVQPFCPYRSRLLMPLFSHALFVPSAPHFSFRAVSCQEATERLQARGSNRLEIVRKGKSLSLGSGWIFPSITTRNHPGAQRKLIWRTCVQRAS